MESLRGCCSVASDAGGFDDDVWCVEVFDVTVDMLWDGCRLDTSEGGEWKSEALVTEDPESWREALDGYSRSSTLILG